MRSDPGRRRLSWHFQAVLAFYPKARIEEQVMPSLTPGVTNLWLEEKCPDAASQPSGRVLTRDEELHGYREMLLIRRFEEKAGQLYGMGYIGGFCRAGGSRGRHDDGDQTGRSDHHCLS
jgi:hypothetical protein